MGDAPQERFGIQIKTIHSPSNTPVHPILEWPEQGQEGNKVTYRMTRKYEEIAKRMSFIPSPGKQAENMLLPRLYCCFQTGLSLGIFAQFTLGKPNRTCFDKEPRGSKCNHPETELIWRHGASEHRHLLCKGHLGPRWGPQPCLWEQRPSVLFCPTSPPGCSRDHYKQNLVKNSLLILLGI